MFTAVKKRPGLTGRNPSGEKNSGISEVVPDMSLSLRQLIDRHMSGGKVTTFRDLNIPEQSSVIPLGLERMSKVDAAQLAKDLPDFIAHTRGSIVSRRKALADAEALRIKAELANAKGGTTVGVDNPQPPAGDSK